MNKLTQILLLLCIIATGFANFNPYTKTTVLQSGVDTLSNQGVNFIQEELMKDGFPDVSHSSNHLTVHLTNIKFSYLDLNDNNFLIISDGIAFEFENVDLEITFDYDYVYKRLLIPFKGSGKGSAIISGGKAEGVMVFWESDGVPFTSAPICTVSMDKLKIHLEDGLGALIFKMFGWMFNDHIKNIITEDIEYAVSVTLVDELNKVLEAYVKSAYQPINYIELIFGFDYRNYTQGNYMANGENFYFIPDYYPNYIPPYTPVNMPDVIGYDMLQMMISSATFSSIGWAYYEEDLLNLYLDYEEVPMLNTESFAVFAPGLEKKYPNMNMSCYTIVTEPPIVNIDPSGATVDILAVTYFAVDDNGTWVGDVFAVNVNLTIEGTAYVSHNEFGTALSFNFSTFNTKLTVNETTVGDILTTPMTTTVNTFIRKAVLPKLNEFGATGIILPGLEYLQLIEPQLTMENEFIYLSCNFTLNVGENMINKPAHLGDNLKLG